MAAHSPVLDVHDRRIGALIPLVERDREAMAALRRSEAETDRLWLAYLRTIRKR